MADLLALPNVQKKEGDGQSAANNSFGDSSIGQVAPSDKSAQMQKYMMYAGFVLVLFVALYFLYNKFGNKEGKVDKEKKKQIEEKMENTDVEDYDVHRAVARILSKQNQIMQRVSTNIF